MNGQGFPSTVRKYGIVMEGFVGYVTSHRGIAMQVIHEKRTTVTNFFCACIVLILLPALCSAGEEGSRSSIHELDAYAYLSEDKTLGQIRSEALAKRQALEAARTHIQSLTRVENMLLEYDLVRSASEGYVNILEQRDLGIEDNSRYHVWIRAEVEYVLRPGAGLKAQEATVAGADGPLTVRVWTDRARYTRGEQIHIYVRGNRDWYGVVADRCADGTIVQLLPNAHRTDNFFKAGQTYTIPGEGDRFRLDVFPPFGKDEIIVYAGDQPLGAAELENIGSGLGQYRGSVGDFGKSLRGIRPVKAEGKIQPAQFYQNSCVITTGPQ